ncbi:MAG: Lipid A biosynthesis lauroyltransferase [Cellvibrionales bacterium UBA7375]|nr:MAG: Lipid A biosynthesis lauroyltransferase [Cellvibrionales bacterium UBA7375]
MNAKGANFQLRFLSPGLLKTWLYFAIWRIAVLLPFSGLLGLGKLVGLFLYKLPTNRKHIAKTNIELCFPELDKTQQAKLLRENFVNMGIAIMELGIAWWWSKKRFSKLLKFEGLEHLQQAEGKGIILLSIHYTTIEVGAAAISTVCDRDGMYRAHGNPIYDYIQIKGRLHKSSGNSRLYERRDVRGTMKALKAGRTVWYAPDQDYGIKQGVFAPFFGVNAATVYATARLAEKTGATVVPFTHVRLPGNQGYKITVHPALEDFPTGDDIIDATRVNNLVESFVRLQPEQYLWAHRRFKTRPAGESDFYTKS